MKRTLGYKQNKRFYQESVERYGQTHKGVHWSTQYNQYIRFDVLTDFIIDEIKDATIVDAGCGFAEYYHFLELNNSLPKKFIGIDCEASMVFRSQMRYPNLEFHVKNILEDELPTVDYYLASGSLNILEIEEFYTFIQRCFQASNKGFAFNFLIKDSFNAINKKEVIQFCKSLSASVQIKELYLYNDMSIFMRKQ